VPLRTGPRSEAVQARPGRSKPASAAETEQITALLIEALGECGYVNPVTAASTEEKVRAPGAPARHRRARRAGAARHAAADPVESGGLICPTAPAAAARLLVRILSRERQRHIGGVVPVVDLELGFGLPQVLEKAFLAHAGQE